MRKTANLGRFLVLGAFVVFGHSATSSAQEYLPDLPAAHPAIRYAERSVDDPIARLSRDLENGSVELHGGEKALGYLSALLEYLDIYTDSQALVFSKTSFQATKIAPDNPRAIYFNDEVALAFIRGSDMIELASIDPEIGPIFYTANIRQLATEGFERRQVCLKCHLGPATSGVPGLFVGSVFPGPTGRPAREDAIITDHRTPFRDRWGGWYVNATRGQQEDRSNAVARNPAQPLLLDEAQGRNQTHLYGKFDPSGYLAPVSDIVALMTFEHQTQMLNYLTRVSWEERIARHENDAAPLERPQIASDIEALVAYMFFAGEVPLPEPLEGVSTFTETFPARGPRDTKGRSLRDFDLERRLFRYPLSYMVYSRSFDALSEDLEAEIYRRMYDVLTNPQPGAQFSHLRTADRRAILEILRETKPSLPDYFKADDAKMRKGGK
ncbi:MAG: hypothetical protein E2P02_22685 [Acidobacteria bacterium]|nr:MAG: hypothetical protein E2P02_22685 [Acidobacteriota bacterium]